MATATACAQLVDQLPDLARLRRTVLGLTRTPSALTALSAVRELSAPRVSELADALGLDLSTVSRQVTQLRQRGWVTSSPDRSDGRSQRLAVTEAGLTELAAQRERVVQEMVARLGDWDDTDLASFTALLRRFCDAQDHTGPRPAGTDRHHRTDDHQRTA